MKLYFLLFSSSTESFTKTK